MKQAHFESVVRPPTLLTETLSISTTRHFEFVDITDLLGDLLDRCGVRDGLLVVFSRHTTAAIKINENEPLLLADMEEVLRRWAPVANGYAHDDFELRTANMTQDEHPNGHAHCQQLLLNTSEVIPVANGQPMLGRWQRVFLVELDGPRERQVLVQVWTA